MPTEPEPLIPSRPGWVRQSWPQTRAWLAATAAALGLLLGGCGPRAPAIEFANRRYSAALRTAANTKNPDRLARAKAHIDRDHAAGIIGPEEYACYQAIIALAEAGRWQEAERQAIRFRRDQRR
jgi:hypothetical protein